MQSSYQHAFSIAVHQLHHSSLSRVMENTANYKKGFGNMVMVAMECFQPPRNHQLKDIQLYVIQCNSSKFKKMISCLLKSLITFLKLNCIVSKCTIFNIKYRSCSTRLHDLDLEGLNGRCTCHEATIIPKLSV